MFKISYTGQSLLNGSNKLYWTVSSYWLKLAILDTQSVLNSSNKLN